MDTQQINSAALYIYIYGKELEDIAKNPVDLSTEDATELLKTAMGGNFSDAWESACLELYFGGGALLLFARIHSGNPVVLSFAEFEDVIAAAKCCRESMISHLALLDGEYYLILYPRCDAEPPDSFFEYGEPCREPSFFALHLIEHGKILMGPKAIDGINKMF